MFLIFGLGDGKMDLQLKDVNVAPSDTLEGTASLTMNKDVEGKEVVAVLSAEKTVTAHGPKGGASPRQLLIYTKSETLDTEKLYTTANSPYEYKFAFVIPETSPSEGVRSGGIVRWYITVELKHEAALKFPVAKKQEINIIAKSYGQGDTRTTIDTQSTFPEPAAFGEMRFCTSCGTQLNPGAAFCSNCGSKQ